MLSKRFFPQMVASLIIAGITLYILGQRGRGKILRIVTTTSLYDAGLLEHIKRVFEEKENIKLHIIPAGTGIAFEYAKRGDADLILAHDRKREEKFLKEGYGVYRRCIAHNHFMIVGPKDDPAGIKGMEAEEAFKKLFYEGNRKPALGRFLSRGDASGTHAREMLIWERAGYSYEKIKSSGPWYIEAGKGMGATLLMADQLLAYTLTDAATFLAFSKEINLIPLVKEGESLLNVYSAIAVNPKRHPHTNFEGAKEFINFLMSPNGQSIIENFGRGRYKIALFHPLGRGECKKVGCTMWKECAKIVE